MLFLAAAGQGRYFGCSCYGIHTPPPAGDASRRVLPGFARGCSGTSEPRTIRTVPSAPTASQQRGPDALPPGPPEVGQFVFVRQRTWLVEEVAAPPAPHHSARVTLAGADDDAQGQELEVFWDAEADRQILHSEPWRDLGRCGFDPARRFAAYVNALRWNSVTATDPGLLQAPFRAGIKLDAYQMEPLRRAVAMPRVRLFIADDTGLGKTIEAGLIARELLLRKKARTIVIAAPASVLEQWRGEMEERFGLRFRILDRGYFARMRLDHGYGVNPWKTHSRFLVSHALLAKPDYGDPMRAWLGPRLPGSLLILDEAHHAAPAGAGRYGIESKFTRAVRDLGDRFEHRLFLSATPHNGHSNSFSTLMELLDPYRFTRGVRVTGRQEQKALKEVMVRRLKEDICAVQGGFPERVVERVVIEGLPPDAPELVLSEMLDRYRSLREQRFQAATSTRRAAAALLTVGLQQRLLSSIEAFARSLAVHRKTVRRQWERSAGDRRSAPPLPSSAEAFVQMPGADDEDAAVLVTEGETAAEAAARAEATAEAEEEAAIAALDREAEAGGTSGIGDARRLFEAEQALLDRMTGIAEGTRGLPNAKTRRLLDWIRGNLCPDLPPYGRPPPFGQPPARWNDRRVLIFTENREGTKRYLRMILETAIAATDRAGARIATIDGLVAGPRRLEIQRRFNAPPAEDPLRILLATDAAREGLNFQAHCTDLFHFDLPWNPGRIEQRNGRIDRKLQPAERVYCRYFVLPQRAEDRVLEVLVRKTDTIRRDLGSLSKVIEDDIERRLRHGIRHREVALLAKQIGGAGLDAARRAAAKEEMGDAHQRRSELRESNEGCRRALQASRKWVGMDPKAETFRNALSCSLEMLQPETLHAGSDAEGKPVWDFPDLSRLPAWEAALDTLRSPRRREQNLADWRRDAPIRPVVFEDAGRLADDRVHLHLEHPIARRLLSRFTAQSFVDQDLSRACLLQTADSIPRVVVLGRLCLFGAGAERLHEALTAVSARWVEPEGRARPLQQYGRETHEATLRLLYNTLDHSGRGEPPPTVQDRLLATAARDITELLPDLERDAERRAAVALERLRERGEREAGELVAALDRQRQRVEQALEKYRGGETVRQLRLFGGTALEQKRQLDADAKAWERRIAQFDTDLRDEPDRIRDFYRVRATRFEPVGLAYLWPDTN